MNDKKIKSKEVKNTGPTAPAQPKKEDRKKPSGGPPTVDEASLQAEVRAFASQLGFVSTGGGGGFDASDFEPSKARQKLGSVPIDGDAEPRTNNNNKNNNDKKRKQDPNPAVEGPQDNGSAHPKKAKDAQGQARPTGKRGPGGEMDETAKWKREVKEKYGKEEGRDVVKGRAWKQSVRPPGAGKAKSLFGDDEAGLWYEAAAQLPQLDPTGHPPLDDFGLEECRRMAQEGLDNEAHAYENDPRRKKDADMRWVQRSKVVGTTADKLAAQTLQLAAAPLANLRALDDILRLAGKRSGAREAAGKALDALEEVFRSRLLPDRKLKFFEEQPLQAVPAGKDGKRYLLYFYFEDSLKKRYGQFLTLLEEGSRDNLDFLKDRCIKCLASLLRAKPEGEARLLAALVNKLGDPSRKLASKASFLLAEVLGEHPGMKLIVAREVERFMFRPGLAERALYYAIVFLNQMVLTRRADQGGSALAHKLIDIYFTLFALILEGRLGHSAELAKAREEKAASSAKKKSRWRQGGKGGARGRGRGRGGKNGSRGDKSSEDKGPQPNIAADGVDARMLSALLTGVRRAFPFVDGAEADALATTHADALFRIVHKAPFGVAVQSLALLFQIITARSAVSDRFSRALYAAMLSQELPRSSKATLFLALLLKALRADLSAPRIAAFAKRLLQIAQDAAPNFSCACLLLLSELLKERKGLWPMILQPQEKEQDDVEVFQDVREADGDNPVLHDLPAHEIVQGNGSSNGKAAKAQKSSKNGKAIKAPGMGIEPGPPLQAEKLEERNTATDGADVSNGTASVVWPPPGGYDMRKREPQYCGAERTCMWELIPLASSIHPSVAAFARTLLAGAPIVYDGDPLRDLSLTSFLDKFVARKPKSRPHGSSMMQPLLREAGAGAEPTMAALGSAAFQELAEREVAPDESFFHRYYKVRAEREAKGLRKPRKPSKKADEEDDDALSDSDDAIDDFLAGEEGLGDEGIGADPRPLYSYDDLAAAMAEDGLEPDQDMPEGTDSDDGPAIDDFASGDESSDDDDGDSGDDDDDDIPEDINPNDLPSATDDSDAPGSDDSPSEDSDPDDDDDEAGWVMYDGLLPDRAAEGRAGKKKRKVAARTAGGPMSAFADADDYTHLLDEDSAGEEGSEGEEPDLAMGGGSDSEEDEAMLGGIGAEEDLLDLAMGEESDSEAEEPASRKGALGDRERSRGGTTLTKGTKKRARAHKGSSGEAGQKVKPSKRKGSEGVREGREPKVAMGKDANPKKRGGMLKRRR